jgi:hypothetical protein
MLDRACALSGWSEAEWSCDASHREDLPWWYSGVVLWNSFKRAVMAIVLIGTILVPIGNCLHRTQKGQHSCCAPLSEPTSTARTNCCTACTPLPAVVVVPNHPGLSLMSVAQEFISSNDGSSPRGFSVAAVIPAQSPPKGAFNLRI